MKVFKLFLKLMYENKRIIIFYFFINLIFIMPLITLTDNNSNQLMQKEVNIAIFDGSKTEMSKILIDFLQRNNNVKMLDKNDEKDMRAKVYSGVYDVYLNINKNMEENISEDKKVLKIFLNEGSNPVLAIKNDINQFFIYARALETKDGFNYEKLEKIFSIDPKVKFDEKKERSILPQYYITISYFFQIVIFSMLSMILLYYNEKNIKTRMKISPYGKLKSNIEIIMAEALLIIFLCIFIVGASILLIRSSDINSKFIENIKFIPGMMAFGISLAAIVNFINELTNNKTVLDMVTQSTVLFFSFISGAFIPAKLLDKKILNIGKIYPLYYYVQTCENLNFNKEYFMSITIMLSVALAFIMLTAYMKKYKKSLQ